MQVLADRDHRAPLGEFGAQLHVLLQPAAQAVEAFGHQFTRETGQRFGAEIHLDARDDAGVLHHLGERHPRLGGLADGFVVQDRARNVFGKARRRQQHFAVGAPVFLAVGHTDRIEAFLDGARGFVDRDDALAGRNHRLRDGFHLVDAHGGFPVVSVGRQV